MTTLIQESAIDFGDAPTHPHPNKEDSIIYGSATDMPIVNSTEDGFDFIPMPDFSFFKIRGGAVPSTTGTPYAFADTEGDALISELVADVPPNTGGDPSGVSYRVSVQLVDIVISVDEDPITANIGDILYWSVESSRWLYLESTTGDLSDYYTKAEVDALILEQNPVGSVVLRMDAINPGTIYGGTWALLGSNPAVSLSFGDGTAQSGELDGTNAVAVPLLEHTHASTLAAPAHTHLGPSHVHQAPSHTHLFDSTTHSAGEHTHFTSAFGYARESGQQGASIPDFGPVDIIAGESDGAHTHTISGETNTGGNYPTGSAGSDATGGASATALTGAITAAGTAGASIDVRGARISINVWQRTA